MYKRGNLSQKTLQILNNTLAACIKESLLRETQFWSSSTTLKVSFNHFNLLFIYTDYCHDLQNLHEGEYFKSDSGFSWPTGLQAYLNQSKYILYIL